MGPERACTILYDDPDLAREIIEWFSWIRRTYQFPLIEKLRPEIVHAGEDRCYKNGVLISPSHFHEFCLPAYREIVKAARDCGGDVREYVRVYEPVALGRGESRRGVSYKIVTERNPG